MLPSSVHHLRLLLETADSRRAGGAVFIGARLEPHYEVLGVYLTHASAEAAVAAAIGGGYSVWGPLETSADEVAPSDRRLTQIALSFQGVPAPVVIDPADPSEGDALIWSLSAFDKFFAPYYLRTLGVEAVRRMRDEVKSVGWRIHIFSIGTDDIGAFR